MGGMGAAVLLASGAASRSPQLSQKRAPARLRVPQRGQADGKAWPQLSQKRAPSRLAVWQLGQTMLTVRPVYPLFKCRQAALISGIISGELFPQRDITGAQCR
jgi:hypothetical protein